MPAFVSGWRVDGNVDSGPGCTNVSIETIKKGFLIFTRKVMFQALDARSLRRLHDAKIGAIRAAQRRLAAIKTKLPLAEASEHFSKPS
jgi:hypothetical protein